MVYLFLADGFEDIEAIATVDILRRASIDIKTVGIGGYDITSTHNICVKADLQDKDIKLDNSLDAVILPGGMPGTVNLDNSVVVRNALKFCSKNNKLICAICAAPSILGKLNLLNGLEATCFPGFERFLLGAKISKFSVCRDKNIISAKGAGCAVDFALSIVKALKSKELAENIKEDIHYGK